MKTTFGQIVLALLALLSMGGAFAKLPAPPPATEESKAAAALAGAKATWAGKVSAFQLCAAQDRVVTHYSKTAMAAGKDVKLPAAAACADPGPFVAVPPAPAGAEPAKKS